MDTLDPASATPSSGPPLPASPLPAELGAAPRPRKRSLLVLSIGAGCVAAVIAGLIVFAVMRPGRPTQEEYNAALQILDRERADLARANAVYRDDKHTVFVLMCGDYVRRKTGDDSLTSLVLDARLRAAITREDELAILEKKRQLAQIELEFAMLAENPNSNVAKDLAQRNQSLPSRNLVEEHQRRVDEAQLAADKIEAAIRE